jgi:hypothetical protein
MNDSHPHVNRGARRHAQHSGQSNRNGKPASASGSTANETWFERFFSKLKHFRRVTTRYDKLAANFLAMVQLASMRLWLRNYGSTA